MDMSEPCEPERRRDPEELARCIESRVRKRTARPLNTASALVKHLRKGQGLSSAVGLILNDTDVYDL
jgi:hypothetical protein